MPLRPRARQIVARPAIRAALVLGVLVFLTLLKPLVTTGWFSPADVLQRSALVHVSTRDVGGNPYQGDPAFQMEPWLRWDVKQVHSGHLPLWNPDNGAGAPLLANDQSAALSPYTLPFYLLPFRLALVAAACLKLWTLGLFTFLFLARRHLSWWASLVGATAFMLGGYQLIWLNWPHVGAAITLPAGLWAVEVTIEASQGRARRRALAAVALATAAGLLAGHIETTTWAIVTVGSYALCRVLMLRLGVGPTIRWVARFGGAVLLGVGIAAVQLLPFLEYLGRSTARFSPRPFHALPLRVLGLLAFPDALGNPTFRSAPFPAGSATNYLEANSAYVGLVVIGLAGVALLYGQKREAFLIRFFASAAALDFGLVRFAPIAGLVHHLPVISLASPARSHEAFIMGGAVLAAVGTDCVLHPASGRDRRHAPPSGLVVGPVAPLIVVTTLAVAGTVIARRGLRPASAQLLITHLVFLVGVAAISAVVIVTLCRRASNDTGVFTGILAAALLGCVALSTGWMQRENNPTIPSALVYPETPTLRAVTAITHADVTLRLAGTELPADSNLWYGLSGIGNYDALGIRSYDELYRQVFKRRRASPGNNGPDRLPPCQEGLNLLGVRWVTSAQSDDVTRTRATQLGLRHAAQVNGIDVWEVPDTGGPYELVDTASVASDQNALATASSCSFPSNHQVVLEGNVGPVARTKAAGLPGTLRVRHESPTTVSITVSNGSARWLLVRHSYYPGWKASLDGHTTRIWKADGAFQAIAVPDGTHTISLRYEPVSVVAGSAITLVCLLALLALLALSVGRPGTALAEQGERK
jgi:hypothetical protein